MNASIYMVSAIGSCLTIILIFANYYRKPNSDSFQRKLLLTMLGTALAAVIADSVIRLISGIPGGSIRVLMYAGMSIFLITQNCTYYLGVVFIDYFAYKNAERSKKFIIAAAVFMALYTACIIAGLKPGWFFTVSPDNAYIPGSLHWLSLALSYSFLPVIIIDVLLSSKFFKHSQANLIILFILIAAMGAAMAIILKEESLAWPCFAAAVLYLYFFILQSDTKIDSLTGIGNRASFNGFIDRLSRQNTKAEYWIVMIDLDKFKEINDTLGHLEGDKALRDISGIIKSCIRQSDFAARYGGDEFVIAVKAEFDMQRLMERIQEAIDNLNHKRLRLYQLYISFGFDVFATKSGRSIYEFLAEIDALMYQQKAERKKRGIPSAITANIPVNEEAIV